MKLRPPNSYDAADRNVGLWIVRSRHNLTNWLCFSRVHLIIKAMRENGVVGKYLDFLYVDEVQDHLIIDISRRWHALEESQSASLTLHPCSQSFGASAPIL